MPVQALTEGALTASDLVIPSVVLYQGTSQERKKSWFSDNLKPGDILLTDGTLMNGTFNPATRERTNAFGVLKVNKYFVLYEAPQRRVPGRQPSDHPVGERQRSRLA